jgi:hypothetical protein
MIPQSIIPTRVIVLTGSGSMRLVPLLRVGGITCGIALGSLAFAGGCGGGAPPTGTQVQDIPTPTSLESMYKSQPKAKAVKAAPKYDMPGR